MLRWQTAGESHGEALVAMIEGMPAGVRVTSQDIVGALARRRLGYGRGARMKFEQDQVRLLTGVRHGETLGSPIAIEIGNTEWPKWTQVMSADPLDYDLPREGRNAPLSRPRPGHADLTGMRKYGFDDARPVLERSSAHRGACDLHRGRGRGGSRIRPAARAGRRGGPGRLAGTDPRQGRRGADDRAHR